MNAKSHKTHSPNRYIWGDTLDQKHPLYLLANSIHWHLFEESFKEHYSEKMGAPAKPIRLMVFLLILKQVRNLSDALLYCIWA